MKATGKIENVKQEKWNGKDKFSIKMNGTYYTGFGVVAAGNGDNVEIEYDDKDVNGKVYHNISHPSKVIVTKESTTSGEVIGESARKKRLVEMMVVAKDIIALSMKDERVIQPSEVAAVEISNKVKIIWKDLLRTIGDKVPSEQEEQKKSDDIPDEDVF